MREDLTLDEQAALTAGADFWHTVPIERVGIPVLRVTDGPSGARGDRWSVGTSACVPCGTALAATWNRDLVRRVGGFLADETHAKGAGVLLAPTVNLHRHPITGRHFECFSEDPCLTSELALAYIDGLQARGVGATIKHFVCNDQEYERHTISVEIDERPLRELYLQPFEAAVRAGVWGVMGAYNKLWGTYCCEHHRLLVDILRDEWHFDGVVMSDWFGTHSTTAVAAGLDLEMPGPARFLGPHLVQAVERGDVAAAAVGDAAARVVRLIERTASANAFDGGESAADVTRAAAAEAIVLLRNANDALPLTIDAGLRRIAVIGPHADRLSVQGGGSAEVTPTYVSSPLDAIRAHCSGKDVEIIFEPGCGVPGPTPLLDYRWLPDNLHVELFATTDLSGAPVAHETIMRSLARWGGAPAAGMTAGYYSARISGAFVPDRSGAWEIGLASAGFGRLVLDGTVVIDTSELPAADAFFRQGSNETTAEVQLSAGTRYTLVAELRVPTSIPQAGLRIGARPVAAPDARKKAVDAATEADAAVVVVGYSGSWEAEGGDRPHMDLPGDQDALIRAVAAANPRTVVVLNAGAPVSMAWADEVAAIVQVWFPGMEGGNAIGDVLFGTVNPSGKLPTTFPKRLEDSPAFPHYPGKDGVVRYAEGLLVGYRHYDRRNVEPRFCFGHGLSYTRFEYSNLSASVDAEAVQVTLDVRNSGERPGAEVVQVYVRDASANDDEPDKQLRDFGKFPIDVGQTRSVSFTLPRRAFATWDEVTQAWVVRPGVREILIGASSRDIRGTASVQLG